MRKLVKISFNITLISTFKIFNYLPCFSDGDEVEVVDDATATKNKEKKGKTK